jgi:hypothetical protein
VCAPATQTIFSAFPLVTSVSFVIRLRAATAAEHQAAAILDASKTEFCVMLSVSGLHGVSAATHVTSVPQKMNKSQIRVLQARGVKTCSIVLELRQRDVHPRLQSDKLLRTQDILPFLFRRKQLRHLPSKLSKTRHTRRHLVAKSKNKRCMARKNATRRKTKCT